MAMKGVLFAVLIFASASANGIAQRASEGSCTRFNCTADTRVTAEQVVNRNAKGDRLLELSRKQPVNEALRTLPHAQGLAEGCEPLASSLSRSSLANIAGRCLS
jgi:hypothetical protein